jgi:hypothetical protein
MQQEGVMKNIGLKFQIDWRAPQRDVAAFRGGKICTKKTAEGQESFGDEG